MKSKLFVTIAISLAVCTILITHCGKEEDVKISEKVKLPEENSELLEVIINGDTLNFVYKSGSTKPKFNAGDIVVGQKGGGYLKKVLSTTTNGDTIKLITEQAALTDAIEKGAIDTTFSLSPASQQFGPIRIDTSFIGKDGRRYFYKASSGNPQLSPQGELFNIKIPNVSIEIRDPNNNLAVSVSIDTIIINKSIDIDLNLEIDDWEITNFRLIGTSSDQVTFKGVNINFLQSISKDVEIRLLPPIWLGQVTIFIGWFPIYFDFWLGTYGGTEVVLTLSQSLEIANEVNVTSTNAIGAEYSEGSWQPIWDNALNGDADWGFSPSGEITATVKGFLKGSLECKIYGVLGPSLYLKPYLYDEVSYPPFDFEVGGGIAAGLAFQVEILDWELADFDYTFVDYTKSFYHSTSGTGIYINSTPSGAKIYLWNGNEWICYGTEVTPHTFTGLTPSPYYMCFLYKDGYYDWHSEGWADPYYGTTDIIVTEGQITTVNANLVPRFSQGTNVALVSNGGVAAASGWASYGGYNATPDQANDGLSPTDYYSAGQGDNTFWGYYQQNCWLRIDFPSLKSIRTLVLNVQYGGQTYYIEGTTNGTDWFTLMPETYIPNTAKVYTLSSPTSVIAIRAVGTNSGAPSGYLWKYMVSEFEAWQY